MKPTLLSLTLCSAVMLAVAVEGQRSYIDVDALIPQGFILGTVQGIDVDRRGLLDGIIGSPPPQKLPTAPKGKKKKAGNKKKIKNANVVGTKAQPDNADKSVNTQTAPDNQSGNVASDSGETGSGLLGGLLGTVVPNAVEGVAANSDQGKTSVLTAASSSSNLVSSSSLVSGSLFSSSQVPSSSLSTTRAPSVVFATATASLPPAEDTNPVVVMQTVTGSLPQMTASYNMYSSAATMGVSPLAIFIAVGISFLL
ncbi:uncharacterized protein VTP21DRAFT_7136 [Calcarisporiella thermophila]|uniref:uncharacterized protein n=1 Tax=Calcarisporiella thermophila TaxID=911321 RepID=UPI0037441C22